MKAYRTEYNKIATPWSGDEGLTIQFHPVTKVEKDWNYIFSFLYVIHAMIIN
jgi:hypothetical protein